MKTRLVFFIIIFGLLGSESALAQSDCAEKLAQAQSEFDQGKLYGIPSLLAGCKSIEAYKLLTITYLYIDDPEAAQNSFKKLLKLDPEYRVKETDPIELLHLSKEFITRPIISLRGRLGANITTISTIYNNGSNNTNLTTEKYTIAAGWNVIGSLDIHVSDNLSISLEPEVGYNSFNYSEFFYDFNGAQNAKDKLTLQEKSYNVSLPLSLKYTYAGKLYYPYVYGGYSPNYNLDTKTDGNYVNNIGAAEITSEDKRINLNSIREPFSQSIIIGLGLMRRVKYKYVFVDVRYKIGLSNRLLRNGQNDFDTNPDINKYLLTYQMRDNDFRQNELNITLGYVWPDYWARKRKSVTVKSFVGGLFKKKEKNKDE